MMEPMAMRTAMDMGMFEAATAAAKGQRLSLEELTARTKPDQLLAGTLVPNSSRCHTE